MKAKKSILFINNGYCCGRGEIINRLENWCLKNKIPYEKTGTLENSTATWNEKTVTLKPTITVSQVLKELGLLE